ncbi:MAG: ankyrin repeat domain-containing protein [Candidatus Aminicenantaceae bacterium]
MATTPNLVDTVEQWTALMFAAGEGQLEVVQILLKHGADPSLKDVDGDTALVFAQRNGHAQVTGLLESGLR